MTHHNVITLGNTMVLKPSEKVPFTMCKIVELLKEAGLPDGVVNLIHGTADGEKAAHTHTHTQTLDLKGMTMRGKVYNAEK